MNIGLTQIIFVFICGVLTVPVEAKQRSSQQLWKTFCVACHGTEGKGEVPSGVVLGVPDLTSKDFAEKSDANTIRERIEEGKKNEKGVLRMIAYKHILNKKELEGLVDYVSKLNHNRISDENEEK